VNAASIKTFVDGVSNFFNRLGPEAVSIGVPYIKDAGSYLGEITGIIGLTGARKGGILITCSYGMIDLISAAYTGTLRCFYGGPNRHDWRACQHHFGKRFRCFWHRFSDFSTRRDNRQTRRYKFAYPVADVYYSPAVARGECAPCGGHRVGKIGPLTLGNWARVAAYQRQ
jgi:hypothetical protein